MLQDKRKKVKSKKKTKKRTVVKLQEIKKSNEENNKRNPLRKKFIVYLRVSNSGYSASIETQLDIIKKRIIGCEIDGQIIEEGDLVIYKEEKSGYRKTGEENLEKRPEFDLMIKLLEDDSKKPKDSREYFGILFFKIDRLFRNDIDGTRLLNLLKRDYQLISSTETIENTPVGRMLFKVLGAMAVLESDKLSNRITFTIIYNFIGRYFHKLGGSLGFGYKVNKGKDGKNTSITIDKKEKEIINVIYRLYNGGNSIAQISSFINDKFNGYLTGYLLEKEKNKKAEDELKRLEKNQSLDEDIFGDDLEVEQKRKLIEANVSNDEEGDDEFSKKKGYTREEQLVYNILMNYKKNNIRYNGYIVKEIKIPDDLIKDYILSIKDKIDNYDGLEIKDEVITTGNSITFISYENKFKLIEEDYDYEYVEKIFKTREEKQTLEDKEQEIKQKESLFYDILVYTTSSGDKKSTVYFTNSYVSYSMPFVSKSQKKIETAIKMSGVVDRIIINKNLFIIRDEVMANAKSYRDDTLSKVNMKIVYLERIIEQTKFRIVNEADKSEIKTLNNILKLHIKELGKVRARKDEIEISTIDMANAFLDLFGKGFFEKDIKTRKAGYKVFFEKIIMNKDKTLTIVLNDFVAEICGMERTIENIAILDKQPQE